MCKVFIDIVPTIEVIGGMVHVAGADGKCEVWPMGVFSAFVGAGMRTVRDFHATVAEPVAFKKERAAH